MKVVENLLKILILFDISTILKVMSKMVLANYFYISLITLLWKIVQRHALEANTKTSRCQGVK